MSTHQSNRKAPRRVTGWSDKERPWGLIAVVALVVAVLGVFAFVLVLDLRGGGGGAPGGVEDVDVGGAGKHTEEAVDYAQSPPAGGEHNPAWQNAGFYEEPVPNETAVHTLEHGAVWITYQSDLPQEQKDAIRELAEVQSSEENRALSHASTRPTLEAASKWNSPLMRFSKMAVPLPNSLT